ncbi:uncharacterized protein LOC132038484 [Lycium ferocissimum]|uniref:uncharacterized protein LOC132038484 n=1 Tax=Lycium ferocissimum TaxID=112874 RepID=UPI002815B8B8|nr:uncharacterized protein LOC132038484 [Lycium ferocissimum]
MDINELLVIGDSELLIHQVQGEWATKNEKILPYVNLAQRLCKKFRKIEFRHTPRAQNEFADALATIASMIQHPESSHIDPLRISMKEEHAHSCYVEVEPDGKPWYSDIKMYLEGREYPKGITNGQKKTIQRMVKGFFLNKEVLYKQMPDFGLLRCVDAGEATKLLEEVHVGTCGPHMNGFILTKKILRAGHYWMIMESDCYKYVQRFHQCLIHGDLIKVPQSELNVVSSPWPFVAWECILLDLLSRQLQMATGSLVAIDYFAKWVEAISHKSVTKKVVADFVQNHIICRFGVLESIITDNGANLNSHLMKDIYEKFKITHRNSTAYRPQMNGAVEAANKNIKRILRKMTNKHKGWNEQFPYALLGYRTTTRTSTGATPYLLVYGTKAVIPAEVEIPSLRIIQEVELDDAEWVRARYKQLALIDEKRMVVVCHGQLYQQRMARAFNKRVRTRFFQIGQLVLKRIFPHQEEYKGKFAPNWQGPYVVHKVLSGGAVVLAKMDGQEWPKPINSDAIKRYYA